MIATPAAFPPSVVIHPCRESALSSEGLSISLPKCLDGRSARMLCAVALRPLLSAGNRGYIDGSATEPRCLIADIEQGCRGPVVWRQLQQPFARRPLDTDPTVAGHRLGYRGWGRCRRRCGAAAQRGRRPPEAARRRTASPIAHPITVQRRSSHSSRCSGGKENLSQQALPWLRHSRSN